MSVSFTEKQFLVESFIVTRKQREALNGQKAFVVWLTGLSGAGKSTIARLLEAELFQQGIRTLVLDGDNTRQKINRDLDFSPAGRSENIRRIAEIARLLNDAGVVVISALISPFEKDRQIARSIIGKDCFVEVFVNTSIETCINRDRKGLYKKALNGEIKDFTGINSPYELPSSPCITVDTENQSSNKIVNDIVLWLKKNNYVKKK